MKTPGLKIHNGTMFTAKDQYPVLRVTYGTDEAEDLTEDLPMVLEPDDEDQPGDWTVNTKRLTPFQAELWDAYGDACAGWEEDRQENAYQRRF